MGRIKNKLIATIVCLIFVSILIIPAQAELTDEFKEQFNHYQTHYPFFSMPDTVYTFESQYALPDGFSEIDSSSLSSYANWVNNFPIWHEWKPVGAIGGKKKLEANQISRVVHFPWRGDGHTDCGFPIRFLGEFLLYQSQTDLLAVLPKKGDSLTMEKFLSGKPAYTAHQELFFKPEPPRPKSLAEYYNLMILAMRNVDYQALTKNSFEIKPENLQPGDLLIAYNKSDKKGVVYTIMHAIQNKTNEKLFIVATGSKKASDYYIPIANNDRHNPWQTLAQLKELSQDFENYGYFRFNILKKF